MDLPTEIMQPHLIFAQFLVLFIFFHVSILLVCIGTLEDQCDEHSYQQDLGEKDRHGSTDNVRGLESKGCFNCSGIIANLLTFLNFTCASI